MRKTGERISNDLRDRNLCLGPTKQTDHKGQTGALH